MTREGLLREWLDDARRGEASEPEPLAARRAAARESLRRTGFPNPKEELWRHTDLSSVTSRSWDHSPQACDCDLGDALALSALPASSPLVFLFMNGRPLPHSSWTGSLPDGLRVGFLKNLIAERDAGALALLERSDTDDHFFGQVNTASFEDGFFFEVAAGARIQDPLRVIFISCGSCGGTASHPRLLGRLGDGGELDVVEEHIGLGDSFSNPVTELSAGRGARLSHLRIVRAGADDAHLSVQRFVAGRDSRFSTHGMILGGDFVRNEIDLMLEGEGVEAHLNGFYAPSGNERVDHRTRITHEKPHGASRELMKGILGGHSRAVFGGLIHVRPGAQKTDSKQTNRHLLLTRDAFVNAQPQLEIYADDVKCTHGATVGQLDDDALFYLRARGIAESEARAMLGEAFAAEAFEGLPNASLRASALAAVTARLRSEALLGRT